MTSEVNATFKMTDWNESPYDEPKNGPKLSKVSVAKTYVGGLEGEGKLEYLMVYTSEMQAIFVGLERFTGKIGDKSGSFVLEHTGTFENGVVKSDWRIVPDSGTSDLAGITGEATFESGHAEEYPITLRYDLE